MRHQYINDREVPPGYTEYPLSIYETSVSPAAKLSFITLLMHAQSTGLYPGHDALAQTLRCDAHTVRRALKELEAEGIVKSTQHGLGNTKSYDIYLPSEKSILIGKLDSGPGARVSRKKARITPALQWRIWLRDDFRCRHCGAREHLTVDHIHPESKGGGLEDSNLQTLCRRCNSRKGRRVPD